MDNKSVLAAGSGSRTTITATVGYMCIALSAWMLSMTNARWFDAVFSEGIAFLMPLAVVLAIVGVLAFVNRRTLDAVIFFGAAGFFWSDHSVLMAGAGGAANPEAYAGWAALVWAVYFFYVWLGSFSADLIRRLFLLAAWLTFLAMAISHWGVHVIGIIGGYLGLITAILAAIVSASAIISHGALDPETDTVHVHVT